jgi:hypothetical protein
VPFRLEFGANAGCRFLYHGRKFLHQLLRQAELRRRNADRGDNTFGGAVNGGANAVAAFHCFFSVFGVATLSDQSELIPDRSQIHERAFRKWIDAANVEQGLHQNIILECDNGFA